MKKLHIAILLCFLAMPVFTDTIKGKVGTREFFASINAKVNSILSPHQCAYIESIQHFEKLEFSDSNKRRAMAECFDGI